MKAMRSNGLKGQQALSPGQRPGYKDVGKFALRSTYGRLLPTGRKKGQKPFLVHYAFALSGRWLRTTFTQGAALGWELSGLSGRPC